MKVQTEISGSWKPVKYPTVAVLEHKYENYFMPIVYNKEALSNSRLKKKVLNADLDWTHWVTLTFADKPFIWMRGRHILPTQWHNGAKLVSYIHHPMWYNFQLINFQDIGSAWLRTWKDMFKHRLKRKGYDIKFTHVWKYEEGNENSRPHFHFIIHAPGVMTAELYFLFEECFPYGFVDCKKITSIEFLKSYLNKYFKKGGGTLKYWKKGRRWGSSRDIKPAPKEVSEYDCVETHKDYYYAIELLESTAVIMTKHFGTSYVYYKLWQKLVNVWCHRRGCSIDDFPIEFNKERENRAKIFDSKCKMKAVRKKMMAKKYWFEYPISQQDKMYELAYGEKLSDLNKNAS